MRFRPIAIVACVLFFTGIAARGETARPAVRIEPLQSLIPDTTPGWLASAIEQSLSHDLARVRGITFQPDDNARFVVRGTLQARNGELRVNLTLLDDGRVAGVVRATAPSDQLFVLQDTIGEQARAWIERSMRRRSDDVAPDPRDIAIAFRGPVKAPTTAIRPAFLAPTATSLDASRLHRARTYELATGARCIPGWYGIPGW